MPTITTDWNTRENRRRSAGLLGVAALHLLIAAAWLSSHPYQPRQDVRERSFQWVWIEPPAPAARTPERKPEPVPVPVPERREALPAPRFVVPPPISVPAPVPAPVPDEPLAPPSPPEASTPPDRPSAADLLSAARQMAGKVDKQLRKEDHKPLPEMVDTPYKRFQEAVAAAYVPKWTGIATVTEVTVPGTGERLVKVSNGSISYCIRVPSPSMGIDAYERGRNGKPVTCP